MKSSAIPVLAAAAILSLGGAVGPSYAGHHHHKAAAADTVNTMTFPEWYEVSEGQTMGNVQQVVCDCTGTVTSTWIGSDGNQRKNVTYADTADNYGIVTYRLNNAGTFWRTDGGSTWVADGVGELFHYDSQTGLVG